MITLLAEQIEFLESLGYSEPVGIDSEIWAFHPGNASGVMPSPVPEAIAMKAHDLKAQRIMFEARCLLERSEQWHRRHKQVEIWLHAFPFLRGLHCEGCGIIHVQQRYPNYCDRCQEFLEKQRKFELEFPF